MKIRKMHFNGSWYPGTDDEVKMQFQQWSDQTDVKDENSGCVIVPHAGWFYSGKLSWEAISTLNRSFPTVVVCGGHLRKANGLMITDADAWDTPLGLLKVNRYVLNKIMKQFSCSQDNMKDNTIEIQLPIIKHFFPDSKIVPIRLSPDTSSIELAHFLAGLKEKFCIIGSTDFSHYGPNYNYLKFGLGKKAEETIRNKIDKILINHLLSSESVKSLEWCEQTRSACSIGAAVCVAEFAKLKKMNGNLINYYLSSDIAYDSSFVGYAGIYYK